MKHLKLIGIFLSVSICLIATTSCEQNFLNSAYYFINNTEITTFEKRNDTLYIYKCEANLQRSDKAQKRCRIIKSKKDGDTLLLLVERIISIPNASQAMKDNRFSIIGIEKLSSTKIKFVHENIYYNEEEIAKLPFEFNLIKDKFGFTYYEENYLKSLQTDFELDTETFQEITEAVEDSYDELIENYHNTKVRDMYKIGILYEVLGREFVKRNLSPIGLNDKLNAAKKKSLK